ncbi:MAG: hypothetical protein RMY34_31310, partial [Aulosira sp. DedQUE10]|nr:hypothetical protein [Aulosira sp. DedQUE10]
LLNSSVVFSRLFQQALINAQKLHFPAGGVFFMNDRPNSINKYPNSIFLFTEERQRAEGLMINL